MNEKTFTCIVCPAGCRLTARLDEVSKEWRVEGNKCDRGRLYGISEMTDPKRTVTAVVRTDSERLPFAPVRTDKPIKRDLVFRLLKKIYSLEVKAPFKSGDVLLRDFEGSGVNVVLTRTHDQ